jgi:hypothetical protein
MEEEMGFRRTALAAIAVAVLGGLSLSQPAAAGGRSHYRGHHDDRGHHYGRRGHRGHGSRVIVTFGHGGVGYRHGYRRRPAYTFRYRAVRPVVVYRAYTPPVVVQTAPVVVRAAPPPADGQYCREYVRTVTIDGRAVEAYGTACLQPDGSWRIVAAE